MSFRVDDLALITDAMARLRQSPPTALGGRDVTGIDDLSLGPDGLAPTEGLRLRLARDARVVVRPSGTEPKLKCYLEVIVPVFSTVEAARTAAAADLAALRTDLAAALSPT
jgi:phosphomannomutase